MQNYRIGDFVSFKIIKMAKNGIKYSFPLGASNWPSYPEYCGWGIFPKAFQTKVILGNITWEQPFENSSKSSLAAAIIICSMMTTFSVLMILIFLRKVLVFFCASILCLRKAGGFSNVARDLHLRFGILMDMSNFLWIRASFGFDLDWS